VAFPATRCDTVPDAPHLFPALPTFTIEEGELEFVCFVTHPTALNVDLMTRLKPAVPIDCRHKLICVLPPGHYVPCQCFVVRAAFRFKDERMVDLFSSQRKRQRNTILRVAVDAVRADLL